MLNALDTLPAEWEATKKLAAVTKDNISSLMAEQVDRILREEDEFRTKVHPIILRTDKEVLTPIE